MSPLVSTVLGAAFAVGVILLASALKPRPVPLTEIADTLNRGTRPPSGVLNPTNLVFDWVRGRLLAQGDIKRQLRILGKPVERHVYEKVVGAGVGFTLPMLVIAITTIGGVNVLNPAAGVIAGLMLAAVGFFYPDVPLADKVAERQLAFRHALSSYLNMTTIAIAGGAGIESALEAAAEGGDGWAFAEIRNAIRHANNSQTSIWEQFRILGTELGVVELVEIAASVELAGDQGARVKQSLIAKADAMHVALEAQLETLAESQSEKMIVPVVMLVFGMVLFIGFGAVQAISTPATEREPTQEPGG